MSDMTRSGHRQFIEAGERKYQERKTVTNFLKDYEPVEDRLRAFWSDHPDGRVMTTLIYNADGHYIVYAEVWRSEGTLPAASGLAHDSVDQLPPNMKTSALEVAETSAIGRALANLGYAPKGKRPSREEMQKASPAAGPGVATPGAATKGEEGSKRLRQMPGNRGVDTQDSSSAGGTTSGPVAGGKAAAGAALDPGPDTTSAVTREGAADQGSGEGSVKTSPGSTTYPMSPDECDHKFASGGWLKTRQVEGVPVCPRCGMSAVLYRES